MPKRTNDFQQLIAKVEAALAGKQGAVSESVLLPDISGSTMREVDVLLETRVGGRSLRIAIECRDHASPQSVKWIDELIGKYRDVHVDKIVAVSRSGFTKAAVRKAVANNIEAMSLREGQAKNWPNFFRQLYPLLFHVDYQLAGGLIEYGQVSEKPSDDVVQTCIIVDGKGRADGTVRSVMQSLFSREGNEVVRETMQKQASAWLDETTARPIEDFVDVAYDVTDRFLDLPNGERPSVLRILLKLRLLISTDTGDRDFLVYSQEGDPTDRAQVNLNTFTIPDMGSVLTVSTVQFFDEGKWNFRIAGMSLNRRDYDLTSNQGDGVGPSAT